MLDFLDEQPTNKNIISYGEMFDNLMIQSLRYPPKTRKSHRMRGAELGGKCVRKNTLRLDTLDVDGMSGWSIIATESGKAIENFLVRELLLNHPEKVAAYDMWCPKIPELDFSGKLDLIYQPSADNLVVVDFKTTQRLSKKESVIPVEKATELVEEFGDKTKDLIKAIKKNKKYSAKSTLSTLDDYMWQVLTYCTFTFIEEGMLYIISRSPEQWNEPFTREFKEFTLDNDIRNLIVARGLVAQHSFNEGRLPPIPKGFKKTVTCKYCDFQPFCWSKTPDDTWKHYSDEEFNTLFENALAHAPNILAENEVRLKNSRNKGIEATQKRIELIHNPTEKSVKEYIEASELNLTDILINVSSLWETEDREHFKLLINAYIDS